MRWLISNWFLVLFLVAMAWMHVGHGGHGGMHGKHGQAPDHADGGATDEGAARSAVRRGILARHPHDDADSARGRR